MTLTFNPLRATHTQKFKVNGQSVPKIEWKQTDRRTDRQIDRRTDGGDRITSQGDATLCKITLASCLFLDCRGDSGTCVDEELVGEAGVVDVVYGACEDRCQNFEVAEHVLTAAPADTTTADHFI